MKSTQQMKEQAIHRIAGIFQDWAEEVRCGSTRMLEHVVPDEWVFVGESAEYLKNKKESPSITGAREHVVPCSIIRDGSIAIFNDKEINDKNEKFNLVKRYINKYLMIVRLDKSEANFIDYSLNLKTKMPDGWTYGVGDAFERLLAYENATNKKIEFDKWSNKKIKFDF